MLGNEGSTSPSISADGRFVTFISSAENLVAGDTNDQNDVFVKNVETSEIVRVTENAEGVQVDGNSNLTRISADGGIVTFSSNASNLVLGDTNDQVDVFVKYLATDEVVRVSESAGGGRRRMAAVTDRASAWITAS